MRRPTTNVRCALPGCTSERDGRSFYCVEHRYVCVEEGCGRPRCGRHIYCGVHKGRRQYDPAAKRRVHLKHRYGISPEQFDEMLRRQRGRCCLCGAEHKAGKALVVDHDHITGRVRGLLCRLCNTAVGNADEITVNPLTKRRMTASGPEWLERAAAYVA